MTLIITECFPIILFRSRIFLACVLSYSKATERNAMDGVNDEARGAPLTDHSDVPLQPHVASINKLEPLTAREFKLHK
jgi:hypothetical protein